MLENDDEYIKDLKNTLEGQRKRIQKLEEQMRACKAWYKHHDKQHDRETMERNAGYPGYN
jgi:hypothetical protein